MLGCRVIQRERELNILAPSKTKVKGNALREWEGQTVIVSGEFERC